MPSFLTNLEAFLFPCSKALDRAMLENRDAALRLSISIEVGGHVVIGALKRDTSNALRRSAKRISRIIKGKEIARTA